MEAQGIITFTRSVLKQGAAVHSNLALQGQKLFIFACVVDIRMSFFDRNMTLDQVHVYFLKSVYTKTSQLINLLECILNGDNPIST